MNTLNCKDAFIKTLSSNFTFFCHFLNLNRNSIKAECNIPDDRMNLICTGKSVFSEGEISKLVNILDSAVKSPKIKLCITYIFNCLLNYDLKEATFKSIWDSVCTESDKNSRITHTQSRSFSISDAAFIDEIRDMMWIVDMSFLSSPNTYNMLQKLIPIMQASDKYFIIHKNMADVIKNIALGKLTAGPGLNSYSYELRDSQTAMQNIDLLVQHNLLLELDSKSTYQSQKYLIANIIYTYNYNYCIFTNDKSLNQLIESLNTNNENKKIVSAHIINTDNIEISSFTNAKIAAKMEALAKKAAEEEKAKELKEIAELCSNLLSTQRTWNNLNI